MSWLELLGPPELIHFNSRTYQKHERLRLTSEVLEHLYFKS